MRGGDLEDIQGFIDLGKEENNKMEKWTSSLRTELDNIEADAHKIQEVILIINGMEDGQECSKKLLGLGLAVEHRVTEIMKAAVTISELTAASTTVRGNVTLIEGIKDCAKEIKSTIVDLSSWTNATLFAVQNAKAKLLKIEQEDTEITNVILEKFGEGVQEEDTEVTQEILQIAAEISGRLLEQSAKGELSSFNDAFSFLGEKRQNSSQEAGPAAKGTRSKKNDKLQPTIDRTNFFCHEVLPDSPSKPGSTATK